MPYVRRSRYAKRYAKKRVAGRRKFTRYNLYRRRGAKAQASQIYSLNRKVNYVYKACKKPIHFADSVDYAMDNITINVTSGEHQHVRSYRVMKSLFNGWNCRFDGDRDNNHLKDFNNYVSGLDPGTEKFRLKNGVVNFSIMKRFKDADSNEMITGFNGVVGLDIYIFQYKQGFTGNAVVSAMFGPESQLKYDMTDILQPLNSGIWQFVKILKHKRVYLNDFDRDGKFFKMKFKPYFKTIKTVKMDSVDNTDSNTHTIGIAFRLFGESHDTDAMLDINMNFRQYFTI